jgi:subtilisin family serine protease
MEDNMKINLSRGTLLKLLLVAASVLVVTTVAFAQGGGAVPRPAPELLPRASLDLAGGPAYDPDEVIEVFVYLDIQSVAEYVAQAVEQEMPAPSRAQQQSRAQQIDSQQAAVRPHLEEAGAQVLSALRIGANGFRVKVPAGAIPQLMQIPGVTDVARVARHTPTNETSVPWIGAPEVWETYGATGEGVTIAVIDTGIDYTHANLGGSGDPVDYASNDTEIIEAGTFPTAKVIGGFDFAGTLYDADGEVGPDVPSPDPDPLDVNGHGSHVAGTAAGMGVEVGGAVEIGPGVAPDALLYALKVFGDVTGSTNLTSDAIEWALDPNGDGATDDHVDVINMSLGAIFGSPDDPSAVSSNNAARMGVIVVASAGNAGPAPYVVDSPSVAPGVISVAASADNGITVGAIEVESPASIAGVYEAAESAIGVPLDEVEPITGNLVVADPLDACAPLANAGEMAGNIALVQRGTCLFSEKHLNAQAAGAEAIVVFNNVAGPPITMGGDATGIEIPGVMVSLEDGELFKDTLSAGEEVVVTISADFIIEKPELADTVTDFSSRGPGHGGSTFKPDLSAPGLDIQSTAVGSGVEGTRNSGTSMAAPHVAGAAALLRQLNPGMPPHLIKAMLQNSTVTANSGGPGTDTPYPLAFQGTGVVRVNQAAALTSVAHPAGVSFGRLNPLTSQTATVRFNVRNLSDEARTFTLTHVPNQTFPGVTVSGPESVEVAANSLVSVTVQLTMDPTAGPEDDGFFSQTEVDGWFVLDDGVDELRVGYLAVVDPASQMRANRRGPNTVRVMNNGLSLGWAEGFTEADFQLNGSTEDLLIKVVGYRTAALDGTDVVQFGLAMSRLWESLSAYEVDIFLDVNEDGEDDYVLVAADLGLLQGQDPTGTVVTALLNLATGDFVLEWFAVADYNDSVAVFTVDRHGDFGFLAEDDTTFDYSLAVIDLRSEMFALQEGSIDLADEIAPVVPSLSSFGLPPGAQVTFDTVGGPGRMLWLFQNNRPPQQAAEVMLGELTPYP